MEVRFPNGVVVRANGIEKRTANKDWRSFGLYLDDRWAPDWAAVLVRWPDFGLPENWAETANAIQNAYARAAAGERVEIGCAGGLGRTGTVLACMAVLSGVAASDAVNWVRTQYDRRAVETDEQASWVNWFSGHLNGDCSTS